MACELKLMPDYPSIEEKFLQQLEKVIDAHLGEESFGATQLSESMGMSRSTLHRKLKKYLQKPANQFLQEYRLERARELLQHNTGTVSETAYHVGFGSVSYFITSFRNFFGYPPGEILRNYAKITEPETDPEEISTPAKTIALLPLKNDGPVEGYNFLVEGLREEIISRLSMIGDIEVISRTTSDTYRNSNKPLKEIAGELNVKYVLEGSFQNYQEKTRVRLQLIEAHTDFHLWTQPYECILGDNNLFDIQQDLAVKVANDLHAHLTPEETKSLKRIGTENAAAYLHYQNGLGFDLLAKYEKFSKYWDRSLNEFEKAVELDSTFAEAWLKLAETTLYNYIWPQRYLSGFLDLNFYRHHLERARKALLISNSLGAENREISFFFDTLTTQSLAEVEKKINYFLETYANRENPDVYRITGYLFFYRCDYFHSIKLWLKYLELIEYRDIPSTNDLHYLITTLGMAGFTEHAIRHAREALKQTRNKLQYRYMMIAIMTGKGAEEFVNTVQRFYDEQPDELVFTNMMVLVHVFGRDYQTALQFLNKLRELLHMKGINMHPSMLIAYLYQALDMKEEMEWHCTKILENSVALTDEFVVPLATFQYTELAGIYALLGNSEKMYACLNRITQQKSVLMDIIIHLKYAPNFDPYQQEQEFKSILNTLESKFQSEHERLKELLH